MSCQTACPGPGLALDTFRVPVCRPALRHTNLPRPRNTPVPRRPIDTWFSKLSACRNLLSNVFRTPWGNSALAERNQMACWTQLSKYKSTRSIPRRDASMSSERQSAFNKRLKPRERPVPLLGDEIEIFFEPFDRLWIEFEQTLAALANAAHDFHLFEHPQVLGDRL